MDVSSDKCNKGRNENYLIWNLLSLAFLALVVKGLTPNLKFVMVYSKKVTSQVYLYISKLEILMSHYTVCFYFSSSYTRWCGWTFERKVIELNIHNNVTFICLLQVLLKYCDWRYQAEVSGGCITQWRYQGEKRILLHLKALIFSCFGTGVEGFDS